MKSNIFLEIHKLISSGKKIAMAMNISSEGSSPGKEGDIMVVLSDGSTIGTIGGGKVESLVMEMALECLREDKNKEYEYTLTKDTVGSICGGKIKGYIQVLKPIPRLIVFGAGHLGKCIYEIGKNLNFTITIIDDRKDLANSERFKDATILCKDSKEAINEINFSENDYIIIVTRDHVEDKKALKGIIDLNVKYIGVIGSKKKLFEIKKELLEEGISEESLNKIYAPIGLDISNGTPEEIAFGILSEILLIKNNGTLNHRRDKR